MKARAGALYLIRGGVANEYADALHVSVVLTVLIYLGTRRREYLDNGPRPAVSTPNAHRRHAKVTGLRAA